jgi:hypothetical protein
MIALKIPITVSSLRKISANGVPAWGVLGRRLRFGSYPEKELEKAGQAFHLIVELGCLMEC